MNDDYRPQDWYEPRAEVPAVPEEQADTQERRGWTPWGVGCMILLVLLLIAASSLAFSFTSPAPQATLPPIRKPSEQTQTTPRPSRTPAPSNDEADEFPDSFADFFSGYYETVQTNKLDIRIERAALPIDFSLSLATNGSEELSLQALYAACSDSIVSVTAFKNGKTGYFWGTGIVLSADGLILTNAHIVDDTDRAVVTLSDNTAYPAKLVGADGISDLAVLKIEAEGLQPAIFGDSEQLAVGQGVAAIGNPLGEELRSTLTNGIISAIDRDVSYAGRTMTLLQTNAALNEGNSGGGLFNLYGQVVGITNMKMMSSYSSIEGIGFAIPSSTVQRVVSALVRDGEVRGRPAIGITVGAIPEEAQTRYKLPEGLYISDVSKRSDAAKQGVKVGDVLTAVNGTPVNTTSQVNDIKSSLSVGDRLTLTIWRGGETLDIVITLGDTNDLYGK